MGPFPNDVYGTLHGRDARSIDGLTAPVPLWITEWNISPADDDPAIGTDAALDLKQKAAARATAFYLQKGAERLYLFAARDEDRTHGVVRDDFLAYARNHKDYPSDDAPYVSPTLRTLGRITASLRDGLDRAPARRRSLIVESVADHHGQRQFEGDGTAAHPPLFDRDVLAVLPFQVNADRFVVPYYVMTRDVSRPHAEAAFTVRLAGVSGTRARVSATDPSSGAAVPVGVVERRGNGLTLAVRATDHPFLLTIDDASAATRAKAKRKAKKKRRSCRAIKRARKPVPKRCRSKRRR
jgi:hypothetical protein